MAALVVCGQFAVSQPVVEQGGGWYCGGCGQRIRRPLGA